MLILHIGFGKCGTTSLQAHALPLLPELGLIDDYNPIEIKDVLGRFRRGDNSQIEILKEFFATTKDQNILVSLESLIGWNPAIWQDRLSMNKAAFPKDTVILISMRDPEGFLRSFYQQNLHQGHVIAPEDYFLTRSAYDTAKLTARDQIAEIFSVDDFAYRTIVQQYAEAFDKVIVVPSRNLNDLDFLPDLGIVPNPDQMEQLRRKMRSGGIQNRSYSKTTMALTRWREKLLNSMGLKTRSSYDHDYRIRFLDPPPSPAARLILPLRALRKLWSLIRLPRWRFLMHRVVDRIVPYKAYVLPPHVPRGAHFIDNTRFHDDICNAPDGFAVFKKSDS